MMKSLRNESLHVHQASLSDFYIVCNICDEIFEKFTFTGTLRSIVRLLIKPLTHTENYISEKI